MRNLLVVAVLVTGCAAETTDYGPSECKPMVGPYVARYVERAGGTCGPMTDQVISFSSTPEPPPKDCTVKSFTGDDGCAWGADLKCPDFRMQSTCRRGTNGATCVLTLTAPDCGVSTYDVTMTR